MARRGVLRIYLGAAPGVGKTYAMLEEAHRRRERGTDVVIGFVEAHGRARTLDCIGDLPVVPRRTIEYRGARFEEMDLPAVLARRPQVALVDELAHTNVPGSGTHDKRWQDIETLLDAGIDVISTLNIQHLESLNDVVAQITGVTQHETVPDSVVRAADQIELVDMTAEALRRRLAHGNVYAAEKIDAALANYFRTGNLTALRELALLWLADRVEEGLQRYREQHGNTDTWETRERVVVALTGGPEGETLIRRAARIAARGTASDLLAVHVARTDGLRGGDVSALTAQRRLVESLGGSYHSVVGDDVAQALLDFARSVDATQIVLGASRRKPWLAVLPGQDTGSTVARLAGSIDVHIVSHDFAGRGRPLPAAAGGIAARRQVIGAAVAAALLVAATVILTSLRSQLNLGSDLGIYLVIVVITSLIGGFWPAVGAALAGSALVNFYFTRPLHTFQIADGDNIAAVVTFLLVAVLVSRVVDRSARRLVVATRREVEAETLAALAGSLLRGEQALPALLSRVQETFGMTAVSLLQRESAATAGPGAAWTVLAAVGTDPPSTPDGGDCTADIGALDATTDVERLLVLRGHPLPAEDQRLLTAFAAEVGAAYEQRRLTETAKEVGQLAETERARTALLNAVSHDLRTPIAAAKAAVSGLQADDVTWSDADRRELLANAGSALDRLTDLVSNLLDLSRLQAGVLPVLTQVVGLDDVVARALDQLDVPPGEVQLLVPEDLPEVRADAALLERIVANLVQNALRYSPPGQRVQITASALGDAVELRVVDRGPGIAAADADAVFAAFQRRGDTAANGAGVGLGLAIARGFAEAMGGSVTAEPTPGGGATLTVRLPAADASSEREPAP